MQHFSLAQSIKSHENHQGSSVILIALNRDNPRLAIHTSKCSHDLKK